MTQDERELLGKLEQVLGPIKVEDDCPIAWLNDEPSERVYWRAGLEFAPGCTSNGIFTIYDSERAAWLERERSVRSGRYLPRTDSPYQSTRAQATEAAKLRGSSIVRVRDEPGEIVEEWAV